MTATYAYRAFDLLGTVTTRATDGHDVVVTANYDARGRPTAITDPDAGTSATTYSAFSDLLTETRASGDIIRYVVDPIRRTVGTTMPEGENVTFWDSAPGGVGRQAGTVSFDGVADAYSYDDAGRPSSLVQSIGGEAFTTALHYDPITGRQTSVDYPDLATNGPLTVTWNYDGTGKLLSVTGPGSADPYFRVRRRDAAGRIILAQYGNGLIASRAYYPDTGLQQRSAVAWPSDVGGDGRVLQDLTFVYDDALNFHQRIDGTDPAQPRMETFDHDALNRLSSWHEDGVFSFSYRYDDLGNLLSRTADAGLGTSVTFNHGEHGAGPHAVTSSSLGPDYVYDANGNQVRAPSRTVGAFTTFDLPRSVTTPSGTASFGYDAAFTRRFKQFSDGSSTKYAGDACEIRRAANGSISAVHYVFAEGELVAEMNAGTVRYVHPSLWGTTELVTDANRTPEYLRVDPFGQRVSRARPDVAMGRTPSPTVRIGLTGNEHDDDIGLINMRGRMYDPVQARFLTPDPFVANPWDPQALNRYSYGLNNPITFADPSGLSYDINLDAAPDQLGVPSNDGLMTMTFTDANGGVAASESVPCEGDCGTTVTTELASPQIADDNGTRTGDLPVASAWVAPAPQGVEGPRPHPTQGGTIGPLATSSQTNAPFENPFDANRQVCTDMGCTRAPFTIPLLVPEPFGSPSPGVGSRILGWIRDTRIGRGTASAGAAAGHWLSTKASQFSNAISNFFNRGSVDPNRLHHIFDQAHHNLEPVVQRFGSQAGAYRALEQATQEIVRSQGITGVFQQIVNVDGFSVTVKGIVIDGTAKIGRPLSRETMDNLNNFESDVLDKLLAGEHPVLQILREQKRFCAVTSRQFTGVGFITKLSIPGHAPRAPITRRVGFGDVILQTSGLTHGAAFVLFIESGLITTLEAYTFDEPWPDRIIEWRLRYEGGDVRDLSILDSREWQKT